MRAHPPAPIVSSMIRKSVLRFSEKIMLNRKARGARRLHRISGEQ